LGNFIRERAVHKRKVKIMSHSTVQAMMEFVRSIEKYAAFFKIDRAWERVSVRILSLIFMAVAFCPAIPFSPISSAEEKDIILPDSGIIYPGGYDMNTVGEVKGKIVEVVIPESGPVRITLTADKETYIVLASPAWYWKDMNASLPKGAEVSVRGSKSVGKDGSLYIIAQEIRTSGSKKTLAFRSESGKALWSEGAQQVQSKANQGGFGASSGGFGSKSGGSGPSSGGRIGQGSSSRGRGR